MYGECGISTLPWMDMRTVPSDLSLQTIDQLIVEFLFARENRKKNYNRFIAKGSYLHRVRESLHSRLDRGYGMINDNEHSFNFWAGLLARYEKISDLLLESEELVDLKEAAKGIHAADELRTSVGE